MGMSTKLGRSQRVKIGEWLEYGKKTMHEIAFFRDDQSVVGLVDD